MSGWRRSPEPAILDPGDAIVAVRATAICGADLFPFHGMTPGFEAGTVLGHEFAGEVVEVGTDVRRLRPGQRVVNASMISDGTCPSCRAGRVTQCDRPVAVRLLGRLPQARRRPGRARSRAAGRPCAAGAAGGGQRRGGRLPGRHPPDGLRRGRPRRRRGGGHGRRRRLRAGRADGSAVRRRRWPAR